MEKKTWKEVEIEEKERIARLYEMGVPLDDEADALGMRLESLERDIRQYIYYRRIFHQQTMREISFPDSPSRAYTDFHVIQRQDVIIGSDIEIPDHRAAMLTLMMLVAIRRNIRTGIIAGDLVATDQPALTRWAKLFRSGRETTYQQDIGLARDVLIEFRRWLDEVFVLEGNHDARIAKATGGEIHLGMLLEGLDVQYTRFPFLYVENQRGLTKVVHPSNYAGDPITLAQQLYNVEQGPEFLLGQPTKTLRKCHFVIAHCHRQQSGMSPDGAYEMHSLGTLRDELRTEYKAYGANKFKQWDAGFLVIQNGYFYPMSLATTDWRRELGDLYPEELFEGWAG